ncbi:exosortase C-terminal domain/associated protein EpsI [Planctomycetota bacterium]
MLKVFYSYLRLNSLVFIISLAVLLLIFSGVGYRLLAARFQVFIDQPITLPVPLGDFPRQIGDWSGEDLDIPLVTVEYMERYFADDYFSRRYVNKKTNTWVDVYVVYCSTTPAGMNGHRPQYCYTGHGWILDEDDTKSSQITTRDHGQIPCLVHRFHKPAPLSDEIFVMSFYILNGQITNDDSGFSSPWGRRPNITGDLARYVAQVQISSKWENSIRLAAAEFTDLILRYLPDRDGVVQIENDRERY